MRYSILISEAAEIDIKEGFLWYEKQQNGLGSMFQKHISKAIESIKDSPLKTQIRYDQTRVSFLKKFPYGIHYVLNDKVIIIVAVFHTSQDPLKWKSK